MTRRALAGAGVFGAAAVALGFLLLPIVAIFARVSPGKLVAQLSHPVVTDALVLSLKTSAIAQALVLLIGTPAAYVLATRRFPGRSLAVVLVELPLVLPPAVAGIGLIAAFGRLGLLGGTLDAFGIRLGLTQAAVILAVAYVSSPFYVRQAIAAFEAVDPNLVKETKRAINRAYEARHMLEALEEALAIDLAIEGAGSPDKVQFMEIARREGLKAALAWRDARFPDRPG